MNHRATPRFWDCYRRLPLEVQRAADRAYELLRDNSAHPSLRLKKVGVFWSVRVGGHYRAIAVEDGPDLIWVWMGTHAEYDHIVARQS